MSRPSSPILSLVALAVAAACAGGLGVTPVLAATPAPTPAVAPERSANEDSSLRRAPKSLAYIYGETKDEQDAEAEEGGDGGSNTGGEGTGEAFTGTPEFAGIRGIDLSATSLFVGASEFQASDLGDPGFGDGPLGRRAGNQALCFCEDDANAPGYTTAPGYGNDWNQAVRWTRPAPNPLATTQVRVRFAAKHDLEPNRDFFLLEVARDGGAQWETVRSFTGISEGTVPAGVTIVDETFAVLPSDYSGASMPADLIRLRLRVVTDRVGSDEDGTWPSNGAAQIDDLRVWFGANLVSVSDFDPSGSGNDGWTPVQPSAAGDFLKLLKLTQDLDPCRENVTYQFSFVDDGTAPNGAPGESTGGALSPVWTYGPGGFVVNYEGGISSGGQTPLHNALQTPAFAWDLPGSDDDALWGGQLEFSVYAHLPLTHGFFYFWSVRSFADGQWNAWRDFGEVYYDAGVPQYERIRIDVSPLLPAAPESAQVRLGVIDMADAMGLPGDDATPSPFFDNVAFAKTSLEGPSIRVDAGAHFQDSFPQSGSANFTGPAAALALRIDAAADIAPGPAIVPGDSMVATVRAVLTGTSLAGPPTLQFALRANPLFAAARTLPAGTSAIGSVSLGCADGAYVIYRGEVVGVPVTSASGAPIAGEWFFDLPDGAALASAPWQSNEPSMLFPGDELRWYLRAEDSAGKVSTYPENVDGFTAFEEGQSVGWPTRVMGLPSVSESGGVPTQPTILVIDKTGESARGETIESALHQIGHTRGCGYDVYRVQGAGSGLGNGIGSAMAHGATPLQLADYDVVLHFTGAQGGFVMSNGSGGPLHDDGDDLGTLLDWTITTGGGRLAWFGDNFVSGALEAGLGGFVGTVLDVSLVDRDVRDLLDGQVAPLVRTDGANPITFVAGACLGSDQFDAIVPVGGAVAQFEFLDPQGNGGTYAEAAAVYTTAIQGANVNEHLTVPISFSAILDPLARDSSGVPMRAQVLERLLDFWGEVGGAATGSPSARPVRATLHAATPNPFNPRTMIRFELPVEQPVRLRVYDVAGRLVRTLLDAERSAGSHTVVWDGTDDRGRGVSSGVYLVRMTSGSGREQQVQRQKVALIR